MIPDRDRVPGVDELTSRSESRAVSETVGFVLVFALITITIAVTFTVGLGGLDDARIAERDDNVERAFDVLHDNLRDVSRDGVPSRATEIRLAGGELARGDRTTFRFYSDEWETPYVDSTRPIVYRGAGDMQIVYDNGAVFRTEGPAAIVLHEPDLLVDDSPAGAGDGTIVYSLVRTTGSPESVSGDRTVLVVGESTGREVVDRDRTPGAVRLEIDSPQATAWERYYERVAERDDRISLEEDENADVVVVFDLDDDEEFIIHRTSISVEFSN